MFAKFLKEVVCLWIFVSYDNVIQYASGDGNDTITGFNSTDTLHITKGSYKTKVSGNDVIVTVGKGKITLKNAKGQQISIKDSSGKVKTYSSNVAELFAENNFATADNISEIVAEKAVAEFENNSEEKYFGNETWITFAK